MANDSVKPAQHDFYQPPQAEADPIEPRAWTFPRLNSRVSLVVEWLVIGLWLYAIISMISVSIWLYMQSYFDQGGFSVLNSHEWLAWLFALVSDFYVQNLIMSILPLIAGLTLAKGRYGLTAMVYSLSAIHFGTNAYQHFSLDYFLDTVSVVEAKGAFLLLFYLYCIGLVVAFICNGYYAYRVRRSSVMDTNKRYSHSV